MITRTRAAHIRFALLVTRTPAHEVSAKYGVTPATLQRIVDNAIIKPVDDRVEIQPPFKPRRTKLSPEQRSDIAKLICFGGSIAELAKEYGVAVRTIQHVKENYTTIIDPADAKPAPARGALDRNLVAEARYQYKHNGEPIGILAAKYMVSYKSIWRALHNKTHKPDHGRVLDGDSSDKEVLLMYYGAEAAFAAESTGLDAQEVLQAFACATSPS